MCQSSCYRPTVGHGVAAAAMMIILSFSCSLVFAQGTINNTYCITGTSNAVGFGFKWTVDDGSTTYTLEGGNQLPIGAPCSAFAATFADTMNLYTLPGATVDGAYTASVSGCCLVVTMNTGWTWGDLWVWSSTNPTPCLVTTAGCTFNPTIVLTEDPVSDEQMPWGTLKSSYSGSQGR